MLKKRYFVLGLLLGLLNVTLFYAQARLIGGMPDGEPGFSGGIADWLAIALITGLLGSIIDLLVPGENKKKNRLI